MELQKEPGLPPTVNLGPAVLPYSLDIISDILAKFTPPEGAFDPNGSWDHRYSMWTATRGYFGETALAGSLHIQRNAGTSGAELAITQITRITGDRRSVSRAHVECAVDKLSTPKKWSIGSRVLNPSRSPVKHTDSMARGEVAGSEIVFSGNTSLRMKTPNAFTGSWMLFDAVQRLPFGADPIEFLLLDDLELPKAHHQLAPGPTIEITVNERKIRLHSFQQVGAGILPLAYWLDDQHRLLMVVGGIKAFIWSSPVSLPEDQE